MCRWLILNGFYIPHVNHLFILLLGKKNAPVDVKYPETGWQCKTDLKIHNSEEIIFCHRPRVTQERGKIIFFNYTVTVRLCLGIPFLENNSGHRSPLQVSFAKKFLTCYSKHTTVKYRYTSLERLWNVLFGKNYFFLAWSNCKPNGASQFKMDNVSLSKLIKCQIWLLLCTISILMGWSGKMWEFCNILTGCFYLSCNSYTV